MTFQPWALLIGMPPVVALFFLIWKMQHERGKKRDPFTEPLLRPPGEGCRLKIDQLSDGAPILLFVFLAPLIFCLCAFYSQMSVAVCLILFLLSCAVTWHMAKRLRNTAIKIGDYRLGFDGERVVGQELNQALAFGCKVYHDIQFDGFNIDHVIVAPSGVYAVETKTRRKGHGKNSYRVRYDGLRLIYPEWEDTHGLEQAQRNAKSLTNWLNEAVGERVWVEPILTLPGWLVERLEKGKVNVLNPKEIIGFVQSRMNQSTLSAQLIQRISHQLEQRSVIT